nr:E3 ubiquitin-protein ligase RNF31-like [Pogona vitticeps]
MEAAESKFTALRDELMASLFRNPTEQNPESVQGMVELALPFEQKYREIDAKDLIRDNAQGEILKDLRTVSVALNILEKYGRNLLTPLKPRFWRMVKFNNPVFRDTVDTIKGGRDVLRLYGYSEEQGDGLCFPEHLLEPDIARVASVTVDIMLLRAELNLLLSILKDLRTVSVALNILEKYGRNLLTPLKPRFWRMVKFNNPVFRDTVDTIKGGRDVLRLYGYSEEQGDGLCFPEHLLEPDIARVASVTVDIMLLRAELNLLLSDAHPNPLMFQELIKGYDSLQASLLTDACPVQEHTPQLPVNTLSQSGYLPPDACLLCGLETPSFHCAACAQSLCLDCDRLFHKHPSRTHHQRVPLKDHAWRSPPPPPPAPPPSSLSIVASDATSLPPMEPLTAPWSSLSAPRPPWSCANCRTTNDARYVLCVACDRPRGCRMPPSTSSEEDPGSWGQTVRGRWSCQSCTFENEAATVLCAMCERPRLAGKPGMGDAKPLIAWGPETGQQEEESSGWQCEHCTYWNKIRGRVCEMCNRTTQRGGPAPALLPPKPEKEEEDRQRKSLTSEVKGDPKDGNKTSLVSQEEAERRRQEKLREDGQKMVAMIREAEAFGVAPEMVAAALRYSGAELPLAWLNSELPCVLEGMAELATQRGEQEPGGGLGVITRKEVQAAWVESQGDVDEAVARCLATRRNKIQELKALGFEERGPVLEALYQNNGELWRALVPLQRRVLEPFHQQLWEEKEPPIDVHCPDRQALLRRLLASLSLPSWGRAELVVSLMLEQPADGGWELADIVEAVKASPSRDFIKRLLNWECAVCSLALPRNKMQSLTSCECTICPECFALHFTIAVKEKHITDLVCPACSEPEISDEKELLSYFSTLDVQLRSCLDRETYDLFHKKLTEHELMRDPKFQWCTHVSKLLGAAFLPGGKGAQPRKCSGSCA